MNQPDGAETIRRCRICLDMTMLDGGNGVSLQGVPQLQPPFGVLFLQRGQVVRANHESVWSQATKMAAPDAVTTSRPFRPIRPPPPVGRSVGRLFCFRLTVM